MVHFLWSQQYTRKIIISLSSSLSLFLSVSISLTHTRTHKTYTYSEGGALFDDGGQLREADVHGQVPRLPGERWHSHTLLFVHIQYSVHILYLHYILILPHVTCTCEKMKELCDNICSAFREILRCKSSDSCRVLLFGIMAENEVIKCEPTFYLSPEKKRQSQRTDIKLQQLSSLDSNWD